MNGQGPTELQLYYLQYKQKLETIPGHINFKVDHQSSNPNFFFTWSKTLANYLLWHKSITGFKSGEINAEENARVKNFQCCFDLSILFVV